MRKDDKADSLVQIYVSALDLLHGTCDHELDLNQYLRATFLLVDRDGSVVLLIIVLLKSIAFRRNTSCLFTLVVLCIVSTIAPIMATNKIRLGTKNQTK